MSITEYPVMCQRWSCLEWNPKGSLKCHRCGWTPTRGNPWGNYVFPDVRQIEQNKRIITKGSFHHSAGPRTTPITLIDHIHRTRSDDPFSCIGYHYGIPLDGLIRQGRSMDYNPAAVRGHNTGMIAIVMMGNFTGTQPNGSEPQVRSTALLLVYLEAMYGITFKFHREFVATQCPGLTIGRIGFDQYLEHVKGQLDERIVEYTELYNSLLKGVKL